MSTAPEINFSELSNKPVEAVRKLNESPTHSLRVHRRGDEEDLVLVTASHADGVRAFISTQTKLANTLLHLAQTDSRVRDLVAEAMPKEFPWARFLPKHEVMAFFVDLVEVLEAAESLGNPAPVDQLLIEWQHTAEVYADPELLAALQHDGEDLGEGFGEVPRPGGTAE